MQLNILEIEYIDHWEDQRKNAAAWFFATNGNSHVAIFVCPFCESAAEINGKGGNHVIDESGVVNPSVYCDCGKFHAYIKLAGYAKELAKRA